MAQLRSTVGTEYAHFPRIEFRAANGKAYEVQGDIGLNDEWPIGQTVELRYRAINPKQMVSEPVKSGDGFTWEEPAELPLVVR